MWCDRYFIDFSSCQGNFPSISTWIDKLRNVLIKTIIPNINLPISKKNPTIIVMTPNTSNAILQYSM